MSIQLFIAGTFAVAFLGAGAVSGQDFPAKPVRIVTGGVGGGADITARLILPVLTAGLGQPVVVDNRGGGFAPGQVVAQAPPDGYTIILYGGAFYLTPLLRATSPYDPVRDFAAITMVSTEPNIAVVHPSLPVKSVKDLIALAKARPGELNYASTGVGGTAHLAAELFKSMAGVNIVHVPYKGALQGLNDLIGGHVQLRISGAGGAEPHIKSGRLRALAVTSARPSALFPGLPTVAATVPGYETISMTGVFAPAKTSEAIVRRLNLEIVRALNQTDVKQKLLDSGQEVAGGSPEELATWLKADMARLSKVIKDAGIKVE